MSTTADSAVRTRIDGSREARPDGLGQWLRLPSASVGPPRAGDAGRGAERAARDPSGSGFPAAEVWQRGRHPAVFAGRPAAPAALVHGRRAGRPGRDLPARGPETPHRPGDPAAHRDSRRGDPRQEDATGDDPLRGAARGENTR